MGWNISLRAATAAARQGRLSSSALTATLTELPDIDSAATSGERENSGRRRLLDMDIAGRDPNVRVVVPERCLGRREPHQRLHRVGRQGILDSSGRQARRIAADLQRAGGEIRTCPDCANALPPRGERGVRWAKETPRSRSGTRSPRASAKAGSALVHVDGAHLTDVMPVAADSALPSAAVTDSAVPSRKIIAANG